MLHLGKLILHWRAPCLIWAVWEGGSKCAASSLNLLERIEVFTLSSNPEASGAPVPVAPCHSWGGDDLPRRYHQIVDCPTQQSIHLFTIAANALLVAWIFCTLLSWVWIFELSPPEAWEPQARTDPSARIAAKAHFVAWSCCTFLSKPWTFELSPPASGSPQVTTLSPTRHSQQRPKTVAASFTSPLQ